jgi:hypothetical protein
VSTELHSCHAFSVNNPRSALDPKGKRLAFPLAFGEVAVIIGQARQVSLRHGVLQPLSNRAKLIVGGGGIVRGDPDNCQRQSQRRDRLGGLIHEYHRTAAWSLR